MKLTKIALGVSLGLGGLAANAADVAMFPYIVNSPTVTTVVTVVDRGNDATQRYNNLHVPSVAGNLLHWRLNYKQADTTASNSAPCQTIDAYLPTNSSDIQTVDMGGTLSGPTDSGVLFNDPSVNNNWHNGLQTGATYALAAKTGVTTPIRGVLFVHNADGASSDYATFDVGSNDSTVQGEAMVFEFQNGAAWGYSAEISDGGHVNNADDFDFRAHATNMGDKMPIVSFMPPSETITKLFVTPVNGNSDYMLAANGASTSTSLALNVRVGLRTGDGSNDGVAFDRDGNKVYGVKDASITCVGGLVIEDVLTSAAQMQLVDGGYGLLDVMPGNNTPYAIVYKLEYGKGVSFNGNTAIGVFNNAVKL